VTPRSLACDNPDQDRKAGLSHGKQRTTHIVGISFRLLTLAGVLARLADLPVIVSSLGKGVATWLVAEEPIASSVVTGSFMKRMVPRIRGRAIRDPMVRDDGATSKDAGGGSIT